MKELKLFNGVFEGKKILVTGDSGFKGSWLSIWLKLLGAEVHGYSLPPVRNEDNFVTCNLYSLINHQDGDIRDADKFFSFVNNVNPDIAFHLAAQPIVLESYKNPAYTFETNIMGTVNFFEAVRNNKSIKAAVNITSDKCYQNNEWVWGYRENDPMGGKDPYSASKGCSELITNSYMHSFFNTNSNCVISSARAGNVIGGGDWAEYRIIPDFFRALEKGEPLLIRNPEATRPWQHVLEPLSGYLNLASRLFTEGDKYAGNWNFGPLDQANHSVSFLINGLIKYLGKGQVVYDDVAEKLHEANLLKLDISKAVQKLNWKPVLNFNETVEFTANGYVDEGTESVFDKRKKQIEKYVALAASQQIKWSINN
jgi:CDP-glucose 4,6-dehydratase